MLFNSFDFLFLFMPLVILIARYLRGQALLRFITLASLVFYSAHGQTWFILPMIFTTVLDFVLAQLMDGRPQKTRKIVLATSLTLNLGLLFFFKYTKMLGWNFVILPAGISFYTFQTISYMIDVYRGDAHVEKNFWRFAGFISFFPHLVAGPLTRHDQLIPQLNDVAQKGISPRWTEALFLFSMGLAKKVLIADRISEIIDPMLAQPSSLGLAGAWACMLGYTLQIYFDFSGYSDMAIGLGRFFNIELPQNFNAPYRSLDIVDFWRRWHMTLSSWLRDYLYISLGGNRQGPGRQKINLMLTMFLGGLWHGANWTFAAWGVYHGFLLIINHQLGGRGWFKSIIFSRILTFLLVGWGWILFRSDNFEMALLWTKQLFVGTWSLEFFEENIVLLGLLSAGLIITQWSLVPASTPGRWFNTPRLVSLGLGVLMGVSIAFLSATSKFLYFQF